MSIRGVNRHQNILNFKYLWNCFFQKCLKFKKVWNMRGGGSSLMGNFSKNFPFFYDGSHKYEYEYMSMRIWVSAYQNKYMSMSIWVCVYEFEYPNHIDLWKWTNFWAKHPLMGGTTKKTRKLWTMSDIIQNKKNKLTFLVFSHANLPVFMST